MARLASLLVALAFVSPARGDDFRITQGFVVTRHEVPRQLTYAQARARAILENLPLVIGVGCNPPAGDWLACRVETFPGVEHCGVVLSKPEGGKLWRVADLPAGATANDIRAALRGHGASGGNYSVPAPVRWSAPTPPVFFQPMGFGMPSFGGGGMRCGPSG